MDPWIDVHVVFTMKGDKLLAVNDNYFWNVTFHDPSFPNNFKLSFDGFFLTTEYVGNHFYELKISENNSIAATFILDSNSKSFIVKNHERKHLEMIKIGGKIYLKEISLELMKNLKLERMEFFTLEGNPQAKNFQSTTKEMKKRIKEGKYSISSDIYYPD